MYMATARKTKQTPYHIYITYKLYKKFAFFYDVNSQSEIEKVTDGVDDKLLGFPLYSYRYGK